MGVGSWGETQDAGLKARRYTPKKGDLVDLKVGHYTFKRNPRCWPEGTALHTLDELGLGGFAF